MAEIISDKADFTTSFITRDKKEHFLGIKQLIHKLFYNVNSSNSRFKMYKAKPEVK